MASSTPGSQISWPNLRKVWCRSNMVDRAGRACESPLLGRQCGCECLLIKLVTACQLMERYTSLPAWQNQMCTTWHGMIWVVVVWWYLPGQASFNCGRKTCTLHIVDKEYKNWPSQNRTGVILVYRFLVLFYSQ